MALDFSLKSIIEKKISQIENEYQKTQGLILTEDDLKCIIYKKLMEISDLSQRRQTQDKKIYAKSVHTEVSWYDKDNKLTIKTDITILEPKNLSILHKYGNDKLRLPSKQFSFVGKCFIFELKFVRNKTGITPATLRKIKKDYDKIKRLFARLDSQGSSDDIFCYFIIFNKTDLKCSEFDDFLQQKGQSNRHRIIYCSGKVKFNKKASNPKRSRIIKRNGNPSI